MVTVVGNGCSDPISYHGRGSLHCVNILGKGINPTFLLYLWVINMPDWALKPLYDNSLGERKLNSNLLNST